MILADKIIILRKKAGWSQEELAGQLGVTRQSVSKWEGAQSMPDMEKIVQLSRLFGTTTDYLLKDELEEPETVPLSDTSDSSLRRVTMEEASRYLQLQKTAAPRQALATFLCVISPIALLMLAAMSEYQRFHISENMAGGIGLIVLMILVAAGVAVFMICGANVKEYEFLEKEPFETEYGVSGMVKERKKEFRTTYSRCNIIGTILCILSVIPLFGAMCIDTIDLVYVAAVCVLLFGVAVACIFFVYAGTYQGAMQKLLEEDDYTRENKARRGVTGAVSACYWLLTTAIFLYATYGPTGNGKPKYSWIIWAVAGILYAALMILLKAVMRRKKA